MENEISILSDLLDVIKPIYNTDSFDVHHPENDESLIYGRYDNQIIVKGKNLSISPEFIQQFGIRSLAFKGNIDSKNLSNLYFPAVYRGNLFQRKWKVFRDQEMIRECQLVFLNCQVISFVDWTEVYDAAELWDGLLREVIRPIGRMDFDFIFYLGDVSLKPVFDTDEILDVISTFSCFGRVTVVVRENVLVQMESILNGGNSNINAVPFSLGNTNGKYRSVYNIIRIGHLLIYSPDHTLSLLEEKTFEFKDRTIAKDKTSEREKSYFNAGYSMGLLLRLEMAHSIALGLAFSGAYKEYEMAPSAEALFSYIHEWMESLQIPSLVH